MAVRLCGDGVVCPPLSRPLACAMVGKVFIGGRESDAHREFSAGRRLAAAAEAAGWGEGVVAAADLVGGVRVGAAAAQLLGVRAGDTVTELVAQRVDCGAPANREWWLRAVERGHAAAAARALSGALHTMAAWHAAGLVHGDVHANNLLVQGPRDGPPTRCVWIDCATARSAREDDPPSHVELFTPVSARFGPYMYAANGQWEHADTSPRSWLSKHTQWYEAAAATWLGRTWSAAAPLPPPTLRAALRYAIDVERAATIVGAATQPVAGTPLADVLAAAAAWRLTAHALAAAYDTAMGVAAL
jgi:hypothetical protein